MKLYAGARTLIILIIIVLTAAVLLYDTNSRDKDEMGIIQADTSGFKGMGYSFLESTGLIRPAFRGAVYAQGGGGTSNEQLLARAINGEARGEPYEGQVAVGAVILNRTKNESFPKTVPGVIYQPGAFTAVQDGQINVAIDPSSTVVKAARDALGGWDPSAGSIYYFNPATATSKWIWGRPQVKRIGKHIFCK